MAGKIRVVVAKPGLDGHDRGAKIIARALRDAGMEGIYTGLHQTPEQIVETVIQEDADAVGLSIHSSAHMTLFPKVLELLRARGATDVIVFGGGIIPNDDIASLTTLGGTVVVKAQVKVGGRGKAGGVKLAQTPSEAADVAKQIIGMDIKGHKVRQVLIERAGDIAAEYYASFMLDRGAKAYLGMCSAKGGMDIEQVAAEEPDYLAKVHIDPLVGLKQFHLNEMTTFGKIPREHQKAVGGLLEKLYRCFVGADAALVEVNPLVMT